MSDVKISQEQYAKYRDLEIAFDTLLERFVGEGSFTLSISFEIDNLEDEIYIDSQITSTGDPSTTIGEFNGEVWTIDRAMVQLVGSIDEIEELRG